MDSVTENITVHGGKAKVFDAFVNHIHEWWPFTGKHSYTFAPEGTQPKLIQFEPRPGGRFYEIFSNGEQYQIGEIRTWEPPDRFSFTWKGEEYKKSTLVEVSFFETEGQTKVSLTHSGWEAAGVPEYAEGYGAGWAEILGKFAGWFPRSA